MANFRYSHLFTTKTGNAALQAAAAKLNAAEIALAVADGEEKILFKNENGDVVSVATEEQILALLANKTDYQVNGTNGKALMFNETDGGGAKFEHNDGTWSFVGVNDGGENGIAGQIYALKKNAEDKMEGSRIDITKDAMYYTVTSNGAAARMVPENEIAVKGDISGATADLDAKIEAEIARATSAETALDDKIEAETTRATSAETALDEKIGDEEARAISAETALDEKIDDEEARATSAETALDEKIDDEEARATSAETALDEKIEDETTRATDAEEALSDRISAIESGSTQALEDEIARAEAAEAALDDKIEAETTRATSAETALDDKIEDETTRATSAETALDAKIEAEKQRALSAETDLLDVIEDEVANRKENAVASVDYDESGKTIDFYNANNEKIDSIDATAFIKDGMIDSVTLETTGDTTYLVIVWNTDAGKETTKIELGDLFNADNYYTKSEIDDFLGTGFSVSSVTEVIEENERVTSEALNDLNTRVSANTNAISANTDAISANTNAISAEATARQNADVVSMAIDANAGITLTLGGGSTIVATEAEEITLSAGEF